MRPWLTSQGRVCRPSIVDVSKANFSAFSVILEPSLNVATQRLPNSMATRADSGTPNEKLETAAELVTRPGPKRFRKLTWREGSKANLSSRFCLVRVKVAENDGLAIAEHESLWLIAEWPEDERPPSKFLLTTLARKMSRACVTAENAGAPSACTRI